MKRLIILALSALTITSLLGESAVKTITFEDIDFGGALSSVEKVREFKCKVAEHKLPPEKKEDIPYREKIIKSYVRKYLEAISKVDAPRYYDQAGQQDEARVVLGLELPSHHHPAEVLEPGVHPFRLPPALVSPQGPPILRLSAIFYV